MRTKKGINYEKLERYLRQNPDLSYADYVKRSGQKISNPSFYKFRKKIQAEVASGKDSQPAADAVSTSGIDFQSLSRKKLSKQVRGLLEYLSKNPDASHGQFQKATKTKISSNKYYYWRVRLFGESSSPEKTAPAAESGSVTPKRVSKRKNLYFKIWGFPTKDVTPKTKEVLTNLVETLNREGKMNAELIERVNPNEFELREITK